MLLLLAVPDCWLAAYMLAGLTAWCWLVAGYYYLTGARLARSSANNNDNIISVVWRRSRWLDCGRRYIFQTSFFWYSD
jgi:hypothetical protein